jgi:hypothetical protein
MDKSTNIWKLTTISLLVLMIIGFGFYFIKLGNVSKNSNYKETVPQEKQQPESIIPITQKTEITTRTKADYSWIKDYFKDIDKRTEVAGIPKLKSVSLARDDMEVRFWFPIGYFLLEGFILKKNAGQWSAIYLDGTEAKVNKIQYQKKISEYQKELPVPVSGWDNTWKSLVDKGILNLPDATEIDCNDNGWNDGFSLIVEYKVNETYRTYKYNNPSGKEPKCSEAKQIAEIFRIIKDEFRFREYKL